MCFGFAAEAQQLYDFLGRLFGLGSISARACFYIALASSSRLLFYRSVGPIPLNINALSIYLWLILTIDKALIHCVSGG